MDMPTIRIDQDVWTYLQSRARPFEDSPNDVLRRELHLDPPSESARIEGAPPQEKATARPRGGSLILAEKDYTNDRVRGYKLDGKHYSANSFRDVLIGVSNQLRLEHLQIFDKVATNLHGKKRPYFSLNPKDLRHAHRLTNSNLFVETNLNANLIIAICLSLIDALGHDYKNFAID